MRSIVVYASRSGNTRRVAEQIALSLRARGDASLYEVGSAPRDVAEFDLLVVGGPTEGHGLTPAVAQYLDAILPSSISQRAAAAFDTRLAWPRFLSGSAADGIAKRLAGLGARLVAAPESFIVTRAPELLPGELERAGSWALDIAAAVHEPALAG